MPDTLPWVATAATIIAASMTAANLGARITGYGFAVFTFGALCWIAVGAMTGQTALLWTNVVLTILDVFGVWRWLRRQAEVEEGGRTASEASETTPGEALFPVSLLTRALVVGRGVELGRCIDAMAGCTSGRISYVVVSQGGVGGIGEELRRLSWSAVTADGEELVADVSVDEFGRLEELPRNRWPAR
jgi:hypothetical protein